MTKIYSKIFISLIIIFSLVGCNRTVTYKFNQDTDNIIKIDVVEMGEYNKVGQEATIIKELSEEERKSFIDEIKVIDSYEIKTDPSTMYPGLVGFKVIYSNDDYEILNYQAVATYINKRYKSTSRQCFDKKQFEEILNKYLEETTTN